MKKQAGFTLIELIMVIVILGVLSAFALPRFADFGSSAREASLNGLAGALRSSANIARAQQLANGATPDTSVILDGVTITMVNGYPTADADGIVTAAQVSPTDYTQGATDPVGGISFGLTGSTCTVDYLPAPAAGSFTVTFNKPDASC